ncbi:serine/threonine protein phosphatase [Trypanosoma conorhini]|uniref:Serine/threonine protein phosphatase n=1 Tax=Trypanosoma conorhini TaxID=83891 RepID=A0A3R7MVL3_9TRYP|nr:serine/threonine protein phosphatase [Trypanosoma conorhini]RNE96012.1 serine/threonine protein phosphatase [Trypanosoma conorhini]
MKLAALLLLQLCLIIVTTVDVCYGESRANTHIGTTVPLEIHRIIAVGDVHGDADNFRQILFMTGIISYSSNTDKNVIWKPMWDEKEIELRKSHRTKLRTTLIQMGDLIDRGEDDLAVLEMAASLLDQVKSNHTSDNFVLLLGNHELLNLQQQFHYVHPESMGGFLTKALRKRAFESNGIFGRFLLYNFTVAHFDAETLFVHAGLNEHFASMGVDRLNKETMQAVREKDYQNPLLGAFGPLWTRRMLMDATNGHCTGIKKMISSIGAKRIVVGHTPQRSGHVELFCDDSVIAVDVGLSRWMYGNLAALELMVTTYKSDSGIWRDVVMREVTTSDSRRFRTLDESLTDPLLLEELNHAVEEYYQSENTVPTEDLVGDL